MQNELLELQKLHLAEKMKPVQKIINAEQLQQELDLPYVGVAVLFCRRFIPLAKVIFLQLYKQPKAEYLFEKIIQSCFKEQNEQLFQMAVQMMLTIEQGKYYPGQAAIMLDSEIDELKLKQKDENIIENRTQLIKLLRKIYVFDRQIQQIGVTEQISQLQQKFPFRIQIQYGFDGENYMFEPKLNLAIKYFLNYVRIFFELICNVDFEFLANHKELKKEV